MAWPFNPRPAKSLVVLRDQYNTKYPSRDKSSDGMLGDALHAARVSDHNPDANGVVYALDITHDPQHGLDIQKESNILALNQDPRIKYLIANKRIWEPGKGWQPYSGTDPHENHMHISVNAVNGDLTLPWDLEEEDMYAGKTAQEWADIADKASQIAGIRFERLKKIGGAVSVKEPDNDQGVNQILANINTMAKRIDQLTSIVSSEGDAAVKLEQIKKVIGG